MSCKQMARKPEVMSVSWPENFRVEPWTEDSSKTVGSFLHRVGARLCSECRDGRLESAYYYSYRAFAHMKACGTPYFETAQRASSLVFNDQADGLIAVCLMCGEDDHCGVYHLEVDPKYQRQGIARNMMKRALSVLAENQVPEMNLWYCEGSPGLSLYQELGFVHTGKEE